MSLHAYGDWDGDCKEVGTAPAGGEPRDYGDGLPRPIAIGLRFCLHPRKAKPGFTWEVWQ